MQKEVSYLSNDIYLTHSSFTDDGEILEIILRTLNESVDHQISSRDMGRILQATLLRDSTTDALTDLKSRHPSLRSFLEKCTSISKVHELYNNNSFDFKIKLKDENELTNDNINNNSDAEVNDDEDEDIKNEITETRSETIDYKLLSIKELRLIAKTRKLPSAGKKIELIEKIEKDDEKNKLSNTSTSTLGLGSTIDEVVTSIRTKRTELFKPVESISEVIKIIKSVLNSIEDNSVSSNH